MIEFPKPDVEQFFQTYGIRTFGISADESRLVFSGDLNGKFNLWAMELEGETSYPYPLTYNDQIASFIKLDPEGRHILTAFDRDGNENYQFHARAGTAASRCPCSKGPMRMTNIISCICRRMASDCITSRRRGIRPSSIRAYIIWTPRRIICRMKAR